jgi:hypothetical protein
MSVENSRVKFSEAGTGAAVVTAELNSLADDTAVLSSTTYSNDSSTERALLANFLIAIAEQGGARAGSPCQVSLLIVPEVNGVFGDAATLATAGNYIARRADGSACTFALDAAVTARSLTASSVQLPNSNYKVGLLNESGQAFAASGNSVWMSGSFSPASITV